MVARSGGRQERLLESRTGGETLVLVLGFELGDRLLGKQIVLEFL